VKLPPPSAEEQPLSVSDLDKIEAFDWMTANRLRDVVTERWNRVIR
jgi:hypothetical protein